jgi:hypothetical protein
MQKIQKMLYNGSNYRPTTSYRFALPLNYSTIDTIVILVDVITMYYGGIETTQIQPNKSRTGKAQRNPNL